MNALIYCLNILKIEKDTEVSRNAVELAQKVLIESANASNEWISAEDYSKCFTNFLYIFPITIV